MHFPVPKTNFHPNNNDLVVSLTRAKLLGFDIKEGKIAFDHAVPNLNKDPKNLDVLNFSFSHDGSLLAVVVSDKSLVVYDTASWEIKHQTIIPKRANVVKFTPDGEYVVVGDKFGDVYRFSLKSFDKEELILGHVSVLTDLFFSSNGKSIITADRDEKIRVSKFPNGYNIENYCLGHYEFVYQAVPLTSFDGFLVSGGGDDYLNLFNYLTAKHIQKVDLTNIAELTTYTVAQLLQHEGIADRLFVILEGLNALLVFKIDSQDGVPSLSFEQKLEFEQGFEPISVTANKLGQLFVSLYNKETYTSQFNGFEFDSSNQTFKSFEINGAEKFLEILTTDQVTDTKLTKINDLRKSKYDDPNKGDEEDNEEEDAKEDSTTTPYRQVKKSKHKPKANPTSL